MRRTAIYIRVSTAAQAKEGDSIPAQREALKGYIGSHSDLVFVGEYLDDGISGTKADRDAYQNLLSDICSGKIDLVIITKLDRIHRGLKNFLVMQEVMEKHNCSWLAIWEPMYDSATPQGKMIINTMVNLAQFEAENTGQRIRQVFEYKRAQGEVTNGMTPYGYSVINKHLIPDENAPNVVSIFEHFVKTGSVTDTMRYASDNYGYSITRPSIKRFLSNPIYIGRKGDNPNYCPPIIDHDLWDRVQMSLKRGIKGNATTTYVFSGLIICDECGARFTGTKVYKKMRTYHKYRCQKHFDRAVPECSNSHSLHESTLENLLLDRIPDMIEEKQRAIREEAKKVPDPTKRIEKLHRRLDRLKDLYLAEEIELHEYKADKAKLMAELESLENQKSVPDYSKTLTLFTADLRDRYQSWSPETRRSFWRGIIREIRFDKDRQITVEFLE